MIGKHALLVPSKLHYCDDSCFTSCLFADFTQCPCVTLLQRSCCTGNSRKTMIGKHALLVQSSLHYGDDSCFTSCLFAAFTQCPCVALLQRSCCTGNSRKTMISKHALMVQPRLHYCDDSCFTSCLFADFTQCPCVPLLQRSCWIELIGKHKQAKGNECSQYKSAAAIFSSSLPICPIHIFSSDTQACFVLVTSYNTACFALVISHSMPTNRLHTRLYA